MVRDNSRAVAEALNDVIRRLSQLDDNDRTRVLKSVATFFDSDLGRSQGDAKSIERPSSAGDARPAFSEDRAPSPKEFLFQKQPKTDVERVACLAFYLTHFRETPYFKTLDISKLNTEAAQIKFSNAGYATDNATKAGYLASVGKAQKQITAWGEQFVAALPDREAALKAVANARKRRNARRRK